MRCRFHVGVDLVETIGRTPFYAPATGDDEKEEKRRQRKTLHCPVLQCPVVAIDYDEALKLPSLCRVCHAVKVTTPGALCPGCAKIYRETQAALIAKMNKARRAGTFHQKHA